MAGSPTVLLCAVPLSGGVRCTRDALVSWSSVSLVGVSGVVVLINWVSEVSRCCLFVLLDRYVDEQSANQQ